jgi:hypothetical protein
LPGLRAGFAPLTAQRPGPFVQIKKTLDSAQNLENKRPVIFLPPRSMVLKVVRGKILETLELSSFLGIRHPFRYWAWKVAQLSKAFYFQSVAGSVLLPNR